MNQNLQDVQRWMQSVITHPAGVEVGLAADGAQNYLPVEQRDVEQVIDRSSRMTSIERLGIYSGAYYARLIECLAADFPIFRQTVGEEAFAGFAVDYLQRHPSQSYTLGQLGARFADYLAETRPAPMKAVMEKDGSSDMVGRCNGDETAADWADFLVDLARLERTLSEVFDGPGVERQAIVSTADLAAAEPARWPELRLQLAPCVRLLTLRFPLNEYYTSLKNDQTAAPPPAQNSWMVVTRRDYIVRRYELTEPEFAILSSLSIGQTLGDAIAQAADVYPGDVERLSADVRRWFQIWTAAPMFQKVLGG